MEPVDSLVIVLAGEATRRGLFDPSRDQIDLGTAFALVREMPYLRASDRDPVTTLREWRGTCSGKHYLLKALLEELGYEVRLMACTAWVPRQMEALLPGDDGRPIEGDGPLERGSLFDEGPIPDVHNYLRLRSGGVEQLIDATAPLEWGRHGIPVNDEFVWGQDMYPLFEPIEEFEVPWARGVEGAQEFKAELLAEHFTAEEVARRARFFTTLAG